jgi:acetyl esterase/lipase
VPNGKKVATWLTAIAVVSASMTIVTAAAEPGPEPVDVTEAVAEAVAVPPTTASTTTIEEVMPDTPAAVATGLASPVPVPLALANTYRYGPDDRQLLDVYVPSFAPAGGAPVLVYFHAGGWVAGARTDLPEIIAAELARGWAVVSVEYALAPEHTFPAPLYDADLAVRWVRLNAAALGFRGDTVVAVGASAGGHIAAWLAANPTAHRADDPTLAAVPSGVEAAVLLVAPIVLADLLAYDDTFAPAMVGAYLGCPLGDAGLCTADQFAAADPSLHLGPGPAPVYVVHGGFDDMIPALVHGAAVSSAWSAAGSEAHVVVAPYAGHNLDATNTDVRAIDEFLDHAVAMPSRTSP